MSEEELDRFLVKTSMNSKFLRPFSFYGSIFKCNCFSVRRELSYLPKLLLTITIRLPKITADFNLVQHLISLTNPVSFLERLILSCSDLFSNFLTRIQAQDSIR